jgi:hypothetical protein
MYTGIIWVTRRNRETESPIFSFKIRNAKVPKQFRIKIRRGETGERPMCRRTERAKPHHENMKTHRGTIIFTQDFENWDNFSRDECVERGERAGVWETPCGSTKT